MLREVTMWKLHEQATRRHRGHRRSREKSPNGGLARVLLSAVIIGTFGIGVADPALAENGYDRAEEKEPRLRVELEFGAAWQSRNDVQIPNETPATRFSLVDLVGNGPTGAARLTARWNLSEKHQLGLLLAPLELRERGTPASDVTFAGEAFTGGREVEATYRFNSWRVGYRYLWHTGERSRAWIGFTGKVRDAEIRIDQDGKSARDTDVGFVPLLHLAGEWRWNQVWSGNLEVEALGGGPGRAIDGSAKLRWGPRDGAGVSLGYRTIEGGADVEAVYNFAWLHYAVLSVDMPIL